LYFIGLGYYVDTVNPRLMLIYSDKIDNIYSKKINSIACSNIRYWVPINIDSISIRPNSLII